MKLRDSKPLSPKPAEKRASNVESLLVDRLVKANAAGLSTEQLDQFRVFARKLTSQLIATHSGISKKDVEQLEETARKAAEALSGVASPPPRTKKTAAATAASGEDTRPASGGAGGEIPRLAPASVTFAAGTVSGSKAPAVSTAARAAASAPTPSELAEAARHALATTATIVCTDPAALPEPRIFARRRGMEELRQGFAGQVAERAVDRARRVEIEKAFAGAATEICDRAGSVEERQSAIKKEHAISNALEVRRYLAEQREYAAKARAAQLAEEDKFLKMMKAELDAEEVAAQKEKEREKERIARSIEDNNKLRAIRDEMARKAVEEALELQKENTRQLEAKEAAHRDKYAHIAEKQGALAAALEAATAADRAKEKAWLTATERRAAERDAALAAADEKRKQDTKERLADITSTLRGMMAEKQAEHIRSKENDVKLSAASGSLAKSVEDERIALLTKKKHEARVYGEELRGVMDERTRAKSPGRHNDPPPGFILNTKSSDYDLESTFKREMVKILGLGNKKANNSESVGPLLGFGATFSSALEAAGREAAAPAEAALAASVEANPLSAIKPKRVEPRGTMRGVTLGKKKHGAAAH